MFPLFYYIASYVFSLASLLSLSSCHFSQLFLISISILSLPHLFFSRFYSNFQHPHLFLFLFLTASLLSSLLHSLLILTSFIFLHLLQESPLLSSFTLSLSFFFAFFLSSVLLLTSSLFYIYLPLPLLTSSFLYYLFTFILLRSYPLFSVSTHLLLHFSKRRPFYASFAFLHLIFLSSAQLYVSLTFILLRPFLPSLAPLRHFPLSIFPSLCSRLHHLISFPCFICLTHLHPFIYLKSPPPFSITHLLPLSQFLTQIHTQVKIKNEIPLTRESRNEHY